MPTAGFTCASLLSTRRQDWRDATLHPFLQQCQQGTIAAHLPTLRRV